MQAFPVQTYKETETLFLDIRPGAGPAATRITGSAFRRQKDLHMWTHIWGGAGILLKEVKTIKKLELRARVQGLCTRTLSYKQLYPSLSRHIGGCGYTQYGFMGANVEHCTLISLNCCYWPRIYKDFVFLHTWSERKII